MPTYNFGSFEIPFSQEEKVELEKINVLESNMPFFQDSLFHYRLGKYISALKIEGDFVETGVYNGMSAASIALAMRDKPDTKAYLYDSWEGFPEANSERDGVVAQSLAGDMQASFVGTQERMEKSGFPVANTVYRKGWFEDTFKEPLPEKVSILHVDCDFYDSVLLTLETFYDRVTENGLIILDDFGAFSGCREAFYDFCASRKIYPLIRSYDHTRVFFNKSSITESNIEKNTIMPYDWQAYIKVLHKPLV